jgi:hypothetical protein
MRNTTMSVEQIDRIVALVAILAMIGYYLYNSLRDPRKREMKRLAKQLGLKYEGDLFAAGLSSPIGCAFQDIFPPNTTDWLEVFDRTSFLDYPANCIEFERVRNVLAGRLHGRDVQVFEYIHGEDILSCVYISNCYLFDMFVQYADTYPFLDPTDSRDLKNFTMQISNNGLIVYTSGAVDTQVIARALYSALQL